MAAISQIVTYSLKAFNLAFSMLEERAMSSNFDIDYEADKKFIADFITMAFVYDKEAKEKDE